MAKCTYKFVCPLHNFLHLNSKSTFWALFCDLICELNLSTKRPLCRHASCDVLPAGGTRGRREGRSSGTRNLLLLFRLSSLRLLPRQQPFGWLEPPTSFFTPWTSSWVAHPLFIYQSQTRILIDYLGHVPILWAKRCLQSEGVLWGAGLLGHAHHCSQVLGLRASGRRVMRKGTGKAKIKDTTVNYKSTGKK